MTRNSRRWLLTFAGALAMLIVGHVFGQDAPPEADPAAWGDDHAGKQLPMYMTADECLFCHREDIGTTLDQEPHNASLRMKPALSPALRKLLDSPELETVARDATHVLGSGPVMRFLKPNGAYGQFAMHAAVWRPEPAQDSLGRVEHAGGGWDAGLFANRCAGCHATAVETELKAFAAPGLDCFVCHGDVPAGHQNSPARALFSKEARKRPLVEMSTCGQCHLRGGTSRSTGLPYPNQFVPADNLFRDFQVDFSPEGIATMPPGDRHIFDVTRDVVLAGQVDVTCTSCHGIHTQSSAKHESLPWSQARCAVCHEDREDLSAVVNWEKHSAVCQY